jgi:transposase
MSIPKPAHIEHTTAEGDLYVALELSDKTWRISCGDGRRKPSQYTVAAGDEPALLARLERARERLGLAATARVHSCYEAGRDGWWLHRRLRERGIDNVVVDSASIEVSRRARRAKTDRLDADKLLQLLMRYLHGEPQVWSVLREPTPEQEDQRRAHRELQRLTKERTAHSNRISSLLVLHNLRMHGQIGARPWLRWWAAHRGELATMLGEEIERELARLELVRSQIKTLEQQAVRRVHEGEQPVTAQLMKLCSIGLRGAWYLDKELLGWRHFNNRREVGAAVGLVPTPYSSGNSHVELGINKQGSKRTRTLSIELAWSWLRYQPDSELARWFNERYRVAGKRSRRVGIVALARRLIIALWRYIQFGEVPAGAQFKPQPTA